MAKARYAFVMRPFGLSKELSKSFSTPVLEYLPDLFDPQSVFESEYEDLESLAQLASPEIVKERLERLGVQLSADDLKERVLYNDGTRVVIAGLRFKNLDLGFPFVALKLNFRPDQDGALATLKKLVRETFALSAPRGFTFWEAPDQSLSQTANWTTILAGPMWQSAPLNLPASFDVRYENSFEPYFQTYETAYAAWRRSSPKLAPFVTPESKDDLETAAAKGLLASLFHGEKWVGVLAAESSPLFGKKGLNVIEAFVTPEFQGQGLGRVLQSHFLSRHRDQFELIWGHVHSENIAAQKTAQSLGRRPVQQEYFFSLDI